MRGFHPLLPVFLATLVLAIPGPLAGDDGHGPRFILSWGQKGDRPGEFYSPISIAFNKKDELFVTDLNNARVQKFTAGGVFLSSFDLPLDAPPRKSTILGGVAVDDDGLIYLAFMNANNIAVYTEAGRLVREWGKKGSGDGELWQPGGIVLGPGDRLTVADQCNHRVQVFTKTGKFLGKWGSHGSKPGQFGGPEPAGSRFAGPHFLARDSKGRFYTTEGVLGRVQQFTPDGKPLCAWGSKGDEPGGFGAFKTNYASTFGPIGIMVDKRDRVWVSSLNDRVQCFTPEGKFLFGIGGKGSELGKLARPHGMAVDSKGHFYIADAGNERIQKFELPK